MSIPNACARPVSSCVSLRVSSLSRPSSTPDEVFERVSGSHSCASYCCNINTHTPPSVSFSAFLTPAIHLIPVPSAPPLPSHPTSLSLHPSPVPSSARPAPRPKNTGAASRTHQTDGNTARGSARKKRAERESTAEEEEEEERTRPQTVCDISWVHK